MTDQEFAAEMTSSPPAFRVPWEPTAADWEKNHWWADYACWEAWIGGRISASPNEELELQWEAMDTPLRAEFYAAMIDACMVAAGKTDSERE